jgi:hypothetical protein
LAQSAIWYDGVRATARGGVGDMLDDCCHKRAKELHAQAQECQRLASERLDIFVREALTEIVSDLERLAERLEQGATKPQLKR